MLRYYQRVTNAQIRHAKGIKPGSGKHAPKKYDKAILPCSVKGCCQEFFVSNASVRFCSEHWAQHDQEVSARQRTPDEQMKFVLSFLKKSK